MPTTPPSAAPFTLVTGASGYIGGLLVPVLLRRGHRVRVLARTPARLDREPWRADVDIVAGDVGSRDDLVRALDGVGVAYYLLHSMDGDGDFVARDRALAQRFADEASAAGVRRIVYLSGLHPPGAELSAHLGSRVEVGEIFLASGVPAVVLQAGIVLGDGSASFDMLRHLSERLPVMVAPRWLENRIQPIAVDDVLHYLAAAADLPGQVNRSFDIGGPDVLTYREMLGRYASLTGLGRRPVGIVPVLTPTLASHWVGAVTPVPAGVAKPLVGSLVHDAVVHEDDALVALGPPPGGPTDFDTAVRRATASLEPAAWRRTAWRVGLATLACAAVGSLATQPDSRWYRSLRKPPWQPPPAAFPAVWTTLYTGIAVAATATIAELDEAGEAGQAKAFRFAYGLNLALNAGWSAVFFRARKPRTAAVWAGALAVSAADLARRAAPLGTGRAVTLGAYTAWCSFATVLSAEIARRNR